MTQDLSAASHDIGTLIKQLCSRQPAVRAEAELALKSLMPEEVDQLVQLIRTEPKKTMRRMGLWFAVVAWPMVLGPSWLTFGHAGGMPPLFRVLLFGGFLATYMVLFPLLVARPRFQGAMLYCITQVNDSRLLGPLITHSDYGSASRARFAGNMSKRYSGRSVLPGQLEQTMLVVLRNIRPEEEIDLSVVEIAGLTRRLTTKNPEVVLELLALLNRIGGRSDLVNVKALERGLYSGRESQAVRDAASSCRATIEARIEQQKIPETLLRASQSAAPTKELVRATFVPAPVEEQVLLRTSQREE
jgi:hypothetical protein